MSSVRLREIAEERLSAVRAMHALAGREASVLATVDAAARGEVSQDAADGAIASHLAARERCIEQMMRGQDEWAALAPQAGAWADSEVDAIRALGDEATRLLAEIALSDRRFASELSARRAAAADGIARTEGGRAANRAYAPRGDQGPRFTDRSA
ncbi:MAG: hypothetical protein ACKOYN_00340 [Planctomycetota bacterium]